MGTMQCSGVVDGGGFLWTFWFQGYVYVDVLWWVGNVSVAGVVVKWSSQTVATDMEAMSVSDVDGILGLWRVFFCVVILNFFYVLLGRAF
jgi:hypothetical protein